MFYLVIINGLIDSFNPCAVGVLLLYLGLLLSMQSQKKHLISFGLFYILSIYTTYLFIGFGLLKTFHLFGIHDFFGWVASFVILGLGFYNLKEYFLPNLYIPILSPIFNKCRIPKWNANYTLISAIILGFLVGVCEFPCSGGIYLATIALLTAKQTFVQGLLYLLIYNLMFVLPLILIFASVGNKLVFEKLNKLQVESAQFLKLIMGISMLISAILLLVWIVK